MRIVTATMLLSTHGKVCNRIFLKRLFKELDNDIMKKQVVFVKETFFSVPKLLKIIIRRSIELQATVCVSLTDFIGK